MPSLTELARLPPASYMHVAPSNSTKLRLILHSRRRRANAINACDWLASQLADSPVRLGALPSQLRIGLIWPRGILFDDPRVLEFANLSVSIINAYNCSRLDPGRPQFCSLLDDNYQLELLPRGLDCSNPGVLDYYMRLHCLDVNCNFEAESAGPIVGMIAGTCSKTVEAVAQASTHLGTMVVAPTVESPVFARRDIYPNFYRTIPSYVAYADTVSQFLVANSWNQLGLLTNKKLFLNSQHFQQDKVRICHDEFLSERELTLQQAKDSLLRAKNEGCQLFAMDYFRKVYTGAHWAKDIFTERGANCTGTGIHVPEGCTDSQVTEASNGHLVVKGFLPADRLNAYRLRLGEPAEVPMPSRASSPSVGANFDENYFGPYTSDAVYLLANALGQLHSSDSAALHRLKSPLVVAAYRQILAATQFDGFRFGHSHEPGGGFLAVWLRSLQRDGGGGYVSKNLASYRWSINGSAVVVSAESPPALPPSDYLTADGRFIRLLHPACFAAFMRALNPKWSCNQALTAFLAILLTVVLTATAGLFYGVLRATGSRRCRTGRTSRSERCENAWPTWRCQNCLYVLIGKLAKAVLAQCLAREINISEKRWESCAVKVLTENCKSDAVLKFLEEAEVLCKLDHENIIKLLGVSTVNQPYYIVMEFCLHGDLKSFLMARRTHRDVVYTSPEYLTRYAIDIASGLEYLHSQDPPVLHRDVALRNCLVDSFYRVKLGDFGLARMTPNYYRMQAPNFVPVRWMPPEAIQYAYFSVKSDIWAFAVLLYEMITFGKFPFYDWSHQRVMAEVARGVTLLAHFPEAANCRLRELVTRCWRYAPEDRPLVSELLHELRDQPPCVAACLDDAPPTQPVLGRDRATVAAMMSGGPGTSGAGGGTCGSLGGGGGGDTWAAWLRSSVQRHRSASDLRAVRIDFQRQQQQQQQEAADSQPVASNAPRDKTNQFTVNPAGKPRHPKRINTSRLGPAQESAVQYSKLQTQLTKSCTIRNKMLPAKTSASIVGVFALLLALTEAAALHLPTSSTIIGDEPGSLPVYLHRPQRQTYCRFQAQLAQLLFADSLVHPHGPGSGHNAGRFISLCQPEADPELALNASDLPLPLPAPGIGKCISTVASASVKCKTRDELVVVTRLVNSTGQYRSALEWRTTTCYAKWSDLDYQSRCSNSHTWCGLVAEQSLSLAASPFFTPSALRQRPLALCRMVLACGSNCHLWPAPASGSVTRVVQVMKLTRSEPGPACRQPHSRRISCLRL
uniref:Guanylate cyclase n=1 Tax=Macrostomum lignano TaxID=282301 RepID=A0A1I8HNC6_9PLAT